MVDYPVSKYALMHAPRAWRDFGQPDADKAMARWTPEDRLAHLTQWTTDLGTSLNDCRPLERTSPGWTIADNARRLMEHSVEGLQHPGKMHLLSAGLTLAVYRALVYYIHLPPGMSEMGRQRAGERLEMAAMMLEQVVAGHAERALGKLNEARAQRALANAWLVARARGDRFGPN